MKKFFKKMIRVIGFHAWILLRGLTRAACGTLYAISIATAFYGLGLVANAGGYDAVLSFIVSVGLLLSAVFGIYVMGLSIVREEEQ